MYECYDVPSTICLNKQWPAYKLLEAFRISCLNAGEVQRPRVRVRVMATETSRRYHLLDMTRDDSSPVTCLGVAQDRVSYQQGLMQHRQQMPGTCAHYSMPSVGAHAPFQRCDFKQWVATSVYWLPVAGWRSVKRFEDPTCR